jgi:hypothetical protein
MICTNATEMPKPPISSLFEGMPISEARGTRIGQANSNPEQLIAQTKFPRKFLIPAPNLAFGLNQERETTNSRVKEREMFILGLLCLAFGVLFLFFDVVTVFSHERVINLGRAEVCTRPQTIWIPRTVALAACVVGVALMLAA